MKRFEHWKPALYKRFKWIAGEYMDFFGYPPNNKYTGDVRWWIYNNWKDFIWLLSHQLKRIKEIKYTILG